MRSVQDSFYLNIPSSFNALDAAYADPLGLAIPEAAPHKIALGWGAVLVRGFLAKLGFPVAQYVFHFVHPDGKTLAEVARLVQERVVRPVVEAGSVYPLEQTAEAHRRVREGHVRGKVVLQVAQEPSS
jgi:NADPH:quinone reductase-like Zn-dependent oxidoreductase